MFSQTAEYALRAVVWLAEYEGQPQTNQQIADGTQVPADYLSKVLQSLGRSGIVLGARGKRGGFQLAIPADLLTILQIVDAVDPICRIETCPLKLAAHRDQLCPLHAKMDQALAGIQESFRGVTLAELIRVPAGASRPLGMFTGATR